MTIHITNLEEPDASEAFDQLSNLLPLADSISIETIAETQHPKFSVSFDEFEISLQDLTKGIAAPTYLIETK